MLTGHLLFMSVTLNLWAVTCDITYFNPDIFFTKYISYMVMSIFHFVQRKAKSALGPDFTQSAKPPIRFRIYKQRKKDV